MIPDAFDEFIQGTLSMDDFDTKLWHFLCDHVDDRDESFSTLPEAVQNFFASRLMEWEVGNGGFSQAAFNIPHMFLSARLGYEALGLQNAANLIREAEQLIEEGHANFSATHEDNIEELFEEFVDSKLSELDPKIDEAGWWATEERIRYAVTHRKSFEQLEH